MKIALLITKGLTQKAVRRASERFPAGGAFPAIAMDSGDINTMSTVPAVDSLPWRLR